MTRLMNVLLMLFAFAVPWEYSLNLGEPFGNVARIAGVLLLVAGIPAVLMRRGIRMPGMLQWLVLALYLYFACSYFWTIDSDVTTDKIRAYFQVMMVTWIVWEFCETQGDLRNMMRALVAGCWLLVVLTVLDFSAASASAAEQIRFVAEGQDPNDVARFLDLGFPFAALLFAIEKAWPIRLLALGYLPAGLLAVLLTASRGGFSAALVSLLGTAILLVVWRPRAASVILIGVAITALVLWMFVPAGSLDRLATIPEQLGSSDLNDRYNIWIAGWRAFTQRPWMGYGAGNYTAAARLATGDTAHNTVMAVLVTGGLFALTLCGAIVAGVAWSIARTSGLLRIALATVLAVWIITSMVGSVEENRITWLVFGMMALAGRLACEATKSKATCPLYADKSTRQVSLAGIFHGRPVGAGGPID
ncbi:O-antigen ligase family protein [Acidicapsa ligni]|uniref:O-antigen ligase family protein n=1 Tax=Acidicapsa ligni TaxID=542300 RepID=UPI0021E08E83|nr:O-antigen ligase family protein [Acidicapsa ligni]